MKEIVVLDIRPVDFFGRLRLFFGSDLVTSESFSLPYCQVTKYFIPYFDGIKEQKLSKIISNLQEKHADAIFLPAESAEQKVPVLQRFSVDTLAFLRGTAQKIAKRAIKASGICVQEAGILLQAESATLEVEAAILGLCDISKFIYLRLLREDGMQDMLLRIYEQTGVSVIRMQRAADLSGSCIALVYDGLEQLLSEIGTNQKMLVCNLTGRTDINYGAFLVADGIICDAKYWAWLRAKDISETKLLCASGVQSEDLKIAGFTARGMPLHSAKM